MTLFLVHFIKLDEKGWNETAVSHIRYQDKNESLDEAKHV